MCPSGGILIFSAHGVPQSVRREAEARGLTVFDATCPLVTKVHIEVARLRERGKEIIMIGHAGHPEVEGTMGQADGGMYLVESPADVQHLTVQDENNLAFVTQTTLSMDDAEAIIAALRARFPAITGPKKDDICYATQNRQDAVKMLAKQCDVVIVVGSPNSSNSNRLREVARNMNVQAYLVDNASELKAEWLSGKYTCRHKCRRFRPGSAGAGRDCAAEGVGCGERAGIARASAKTWYSPYPRRLTRMFHKPGLTRTLRVLDTGNGACAIGTQSVGTINHAGLHSLIRRTNI